MRRPAHAAPATTAIPTGRVSAGPYPHPPRRQAPPHSAMTAPTVSISTGKGPAPTTGASNAGCSHSEAIANREREERIAGTLAAKIRSVLTTPTPPCRTTTPASAASSRARPSQRPSDPQKEATQTAPLRDQRPEDRAPHRGRLDQGMSNAALTGTTPVTAVCRSVTCPVEEMRSSPGRPDGLPGGMAVTEVSRAPRVH